MLDNVTIALLGTGTGAWLVTTGILTALKAKLGTMWSDKAEKIFSVVLPVVFVEASVAAVGTTVWYAYLVALIVGLGAYKATDSSITEYKNQVLLSTKEEKSKK